jgi:hypothetical protein
VTGLGKKIWPLGKGKPHAVVGHGQSQLFQIAPDADDNVLGLRVLDGVV